MMRVLLVILGVLLCLVLILWWSSRPAPHSPEVLRAAAMTGDSELVFIVLRQQPNLIEYRDSAGIGIIHHAAYSGNASLVEELIKRGAKVNALDGRGRSALYYAIRGSLTPGVRTGKFSGTFTLLTEHGLSLQGDPHFETLADLILNAGSGELLSYFGSSLTEAPQQDESGLTPLHYAALEGNEEQFAALLAQGHDPHAKDPKGRTPQQIIEQHREQVSLLDSELESEDPGGITE